MASRRPWAGGWVDAELATTRFADILYALPYMLARYPRRPTTSRTIILAMTLISWIPMARIVRSQLLSLKTREYILALPKDGERGKRVCSSIICFPMPGPYFSDPYPDCSFLLLFL